MILNELSRKDCEASPWDCEASRRSTGTVRGKTSRRFPAFKLVFGAILRDAARQ